MDATARDFFQICPPSTVGLDHIFIEPVTIELDMDRVDIKSDRLVNSFNELLTIPDRPVKTFDELVAKSGRSGKTFDELITTPDRHPTPDSTLEPLFKRLSDIESQLAKTQSELQGAVWRNGYLEAQLEAERRQVKLLTDSQNKNNWWAKFMSWFFRSR
jgi:hypothetical protein